MAVRGNSKLDPDLGAEIRRGQAAHAYLLRGSDAPQQAFLLAMALNCQNLQEGQPCGTCPNCRKLELGSFADLDQVYPDKGWLRIEQMRNLQSRAGLGKVEGEKKIIIIHEADLLREEAANSLLKILEEPPEDTVFILTAANGDKLLATVLSRCRIYQTGSEISFSLNEEQLEEYLPKAQSFLESLKGASCVVPLAAAKGFEKDKDSLLYMLLALWQVLAERAKAGDEPALKAALFVERSISLLRRNISQKILTDVIFLRLWKMQNN